MDAVLLDAVREAKVSWGNPRWSAPAEFVARAVEESARLPADGICVECGSGLSTAILAGVLGPRLVTIEDKAEWLDYAMERIPGNGQVYVRSPLVVHDGYTWYACGRDEGFMRQLGTRVGLVVCDGPASGRGGMLYELWPAFAPFFTVMLDDYHRPMEAGIVEDWIRSLRAHGASLTVETLNCEEERKAAVIRVSMRKVMLP